MNRLLLPLLLAIGLAACAAGPDAAPTPSPLPTPSPTPVATATPAPSATPPPATEAPVPERFGSLEFDGARALAHAEAQCAIGPRPTGSEALLETRAYIEEVLRAEGWEVVRQDGEFMGVPIHNVVGVKGEGSPRMVGAHYDTRPAAELDPEQPDAPIIGGNDGASGVAALLELARTVEVPEGRQVQLAFFDAEDRGNLDEWPFSVGAAQMAADLPVARPEAVVVLDMIGDAQQEIYREKNSDPALNDDLFAIAAALGFAGQGFYNSDRWSIIDDHLPFINAGIPAADLIDFDYPYWHTTEDTCDKLAADSLYRVGRVIESWLQEQ